MGVQYISEVLKEIHSKDVNCKNIIANTLIEYELLHNTTAIVCVGTDRGVADSIAPFTGLFLENAKLGINIYGTLKKPIHYQNMFDIIPKIKDKEPRILAIDSSFGERDDIGKIIIKSIGIEAGAGLNKKPLNIGDVSIVYVVGEFESALECLNNNIRLNDIYQAAQSIAEGIIDAKIRLHSNNNSKAISIRK